MCRFEPSFNRPCNLPTSRFIFIKIDTVISPIEGWTSVIHALNGNSNEYARWLDLSWFVRPSLLKNVDLLELFFLELFRTFFSN